MLFLQISLLEAQITSICNQEMELRDELSECKQTAETVRYTVCPKRHEIYFFAALLLVAACSNRLVEVGGTLIFITHQRSVCCENQKDRDS